MPVRSLSETRQKLVLWVAILLIATATALSFFSTQRLVSLGAEVERSQRVMTELNRLVSDLKDVETGARGYIITGDRRYLLPFEAGPRRFSETVGRLTALSENDADFKNRLARLAQLGRERTRLAGQAIASRQAVAITPETRRFIDRGKATMDQIRSEADALLAEEQGEHRTQGIAVERQVWVATGALVLGVALSLAAIGWLFAIRSREAARRRSVEEELRALNAELEDRVQARTAEVQHSRELLDAVIENMPDTIFLKDADDDCRYLLVNEAGERLLGRSRDEMLGRVDHELFPRDQARLCREEDLEVAVTGEERIVTERRVSTEGGERVIESRKVPITGASGGHRLVLGIVRDVTEQKSMEEQVRQMQRMDAVGRLTGGIAHDFNNLLAIILGNVEMLREKVEDGSDAAEMADETVGAAMRGAELVRRMLAFARMQHLEPTVVDLNQRLPEVTALLRRSLGENIAVEVRTEPSLWKAMVDPTQVDDAILNLAINARDAMPEGGRICIETANVRLDEDYAAHHAEVDPGDYVALVVSDTGTGMPSDVIARAFEPFFTTKETGRGTGLGLSQIYGWVKQSGGHIKIYSEVGHGTSVKLYLPRSDARDAEEDEPGAHQDSRALSMGNETILVVEDNRDVRRTVVRQLHDLGFPAIEAEDGAEALALVRAGAEFDLLLTDIVMPGGMTGYELAEEVRKLRPAQKVLFTSGYTELAVATGNPGRSGPLLSKPYRKQELGRAIRAVLDDGAERL